MENSIREMLEINSRQKVYYEVAHGHGEASANNKSTNLYRRLKLRALGTLKSTSLAADVDSLHRQWAGDLTDKSVLDLGCGAGNSLSLEFAIAARQYIAVDLSEKRCELLRAKLAAAGARNASVRAADFLSPDFDEGPFDIIYAKSVFHHFEHFEAFLTVVASRLAPGGRVIIYDPVAIWWPARLLRAVFRPWQTDAAWEFPFSRRSLASLERHFDIAACRGLLGRSKWAVTAGLFAPAMGVRLAQKWHDRDMRENTSLARSRSCLHLTAALAHKGGGISPTRHGGPARL